MHFINNHADWIKDHWIEQAIQKTGYRIPFDFFKNSKVFEEEEKGMRQSMDPSEIAIYRTYGTTGTFFHLLEAQLFDFELDRPPWIDNNKKFTWWMTKMYPGQYIPAHQDVIKRDDPDSKRYWVPLFDWQPGHVFMYESETFTDYKAGDVFLYDNLRAWHCGINIGTKLRLIMQVTEYGDIND